MLGLPLAFTIPVALGTLALLPVLYWLLRVTPPRPRQIPFPPLRLILNLEPREEKPARTPPWLLLLRLAVAALIILAMAGPIWNPPPAAPGGTGPLLVLLDDGFAAAPTWDARIAAAAERLTEAARGGRPAAVAALSDGSREILPTTATAASERLRALKPVPVLPDRAAAMPAVQAFAAAHADTDILWIADGLENGGARSFAEALVGSGGARRPTVLLAADTPAGITHAENAPDALVVHLNRADAHAAGRGTLRALDLKGLPIGEAGFDFGTGTTAEASFGLPVELRNQIARVGIEGVASAGAVTLLDGRWKRRRVEIVSGATADVAQPLLSPSYFLAKALAPFADVREVRTGVADPVAAALDEAPSMMILADVGQVSGPAHDRLSEFVDRGGILLRFAGSRLAGAGDDLEPVALRRGGRTFGGSLSWDKPKPLAAFDRASPFFGLVPPSDVTITRQVLAEPDAGLAGRTWAQLDDGTPLVTAQRRGKGTIVLFHVTADTTWSNLPLSGLFVDMLRRIVALSGQTAASGRDDAAGQSKVSADVPALPPSRILDGFGVLGGPPPTAKPIPAGFNGIGTADHPPGFYGSADALVAVNALGPDSTLAAAAFDGLALDRQVLKPSQPIDLRAALIVLAFAGFLLDQLVSLWLGGGLRAPGRRQAAVSALVLFGLLLIGGRPSELAAAEATATQRTMDAALTTRMAYVATGNPSVDETSRLGLTSLSRALASRTSLDPGEPVEVDPGRDELAFYPLLYWPVVANAPQPAPAAVAKVAAFMKNGGTVIFDTRDALTKQPGGSMTPEGLWLQTLLSGVDVPELEPVPHDHVITKTFYLLDSFVGRYTNGETWVEALPPASPEQVNRPARSGDSVSPIVITSNDLAAGWATDAEGEPLYPLVPGGVRQRELALRSGINLVIYTMTGNYKADQVHVRDLLERLAH